ncbi:MAG: DUF4192 domain-containing protein [Ornithinimicrobium sp.]
MDSCADPPPVTLYGLEQTIVTLPYQLGYHPRDSLVVVCMTAASPLAGDPLSPPAERVSLTARVDLPEPREHAGVLAALGPALARPETQALVAVAFADTPPFAPHVTGLLAQVGELAREREVAVRALALVCRHRWCTVSGCAEQGPWRSLPPARDVPAVADFVAVGRAPLRDRGVLEGLLRPADPGLLAAVRTALHAQGGCASPQDVPTLALINARAAAEVLAEIVAGTGTRAAPALPSAADIACVASALHHVPLRDAVLSRLTHADTGAAAAGGGLQDAVHQAISRTLPHGRATAARLATVGAHVPAPWAAPWLTVTGFVAWQAGDGALANIAIERALRCDPRYALARLMSLALTSALPPARPRTTGGGARCV